MKYHLSISTFTASNKFTITVGKRPNMRQPYFCLSLTNKRYSSCLCLNLNKLFEFDRLKKTMQQGFFHMMFRIYLVLVTRRVNKFWSSRFRFLLSEIISQMLLRCEWSQFLRHFLKCRYLTTIAWPHHLKLVLLLLS